jgi:hypothetical protein
MPTLETITGRLNKLILQVGITHTPARWGGRCLGVPKIFRERGQIISRVKKSPTARTPLPTPRRKRSF